jgi:hypothetical protein
MAVSHNMYLYYARINGLTFRDQDPQDVDHCRERGDEGVAGDDIALDRAESDLDVKRASEWIAFSDFNFTDNYSIQYQDPVDGLRSRH